MSAANDRLVWIDCEMTGLDLAIDELVEVAVVITDYDLNPVHPGFSIVIAPSPTALANMSDFVRQMHETSGLLDELALGADLPDAEKAVLDYIVEHVPTAGSAPLAGNTIGTDRAFLQRSMPSVDAHLHYRSVDVSSIKELARRWFPRIYFNAPEKNGGHRALADILESIRELAYYRRAAFVPEPGPTTEALQTVSGEVVDAWSGHLPVVRGGH
ncbi:oligoribonuclease [Microcella alkaliphila]|uniref:Oligoribonuclease n=1 Tax=Microcella alkaliphila TaxID=279828 RepID=A0A0U5BAI1_9MICO|nr:oligoribonuclease [Microcella alkaliphila]BAU32772.1 oligoribonuclease [Microcella alkaliphila]